MKNNIDFDKLNNYINEIKTSNNISSFYMERLDKIYRLSIRYNILMYRELGYSSMETSKVSIGDKELLDLSKDYLKTISKKYLDLFDDLIKNDQIDITLDNNKESSAEYDYFKRKPIITVKKEESYFDVLQLVHEFMHYTNFNYSNINNPLRRDLTEFVSIYHELLCSIELLRNFNISPNRLNNINRLFNTFECSMDVMNSFLPLIVGVNEDSVNILNKEYNIRITEDTFKENVTNLSKIINHSYDKETFIKYFNDTCSYLFCTYLAFYSAFDNTLNDLMYINNNLNRINVSPDSLLDDINLKIDNIFENKALNNIRKYVKKYILLK